MDTGGATPNEAGQNGVVTFQTRLIVAVIVCTEHRKKGLFFVLAHMRKSMKYGRRTRAFH
jgi:hypothetical protein